MGLFNRRNKEETVNEQERLDEELRDDLSKAYDELMAEGRTEGEQDDVPEAERAEMTEDYSAELLKSKIKEFKENKTDVLLMEVIKMLSGRRFFLPSVSNMKQPFENVNGEAKLKKGATINPALLSSQDKKTYLPIFTDEKSMVQKSPSGVVLKFNFEQCVGIVYNKKNPVVGIVINPFTENFILGEQILRPVFKEIEKNS